MARKPPAPGKLFKAKSYLSLRDAASALSKMLGEDVSKADVLQLGLERQLKLSVNFLNAVPAVFGQLKPLERCTCKIVLAPWAKPATADAMDFEWEGESITVADLPSLPAATQTALKKLNLIALPEGVDWDHSQRLVLDSELQQIEGVWDLPMIGAERLEVAGRYRRAAEEPDDDDGIIDCLFVTQGDITARLMEASGRSVFQTGTLAAAALLEAKVASGRIPANQAQALRQQQDEARKTLRGRAGQKSHPDGYHPAVVFPKGAEIVVKPSALSDFVRTLEGGKSPSGQLDHRERTTMLNIIGAQLALLMDSTRPRLPSQADVVNALVERYPSVYGCAQRTLEGKFAEANRSLKQQQ